MSRFLRDKPATDRTPQRQSISESRLGPVAQTVYVVQNGPNAGRVVGYEVDGEFVEVGSCCESPALCDRPECWRPLSEWGRS